MDQQPAVCEAQSAAATEAGASAKGSKRPREQPGSTSGAGSEDLSAVSCCTVCATPASTEELDTMLLKNLPHGATSSLFVCFHGCAADGTDTAAACHRSCIL